jgi:hypothetical protein
MTAGLLGLALVPMIGAVAPEPPVNTPQPRVPVAMAQPIAAMDRSSLVTIPASRASDAILPESGMLVLVGSALMGLAAVVRRTTNHS